MSATTTDRPSIINRELERMRDILTNGIDGSFESFLFDYYPDFSWGPAIIEELTTLINDPEWLALAEQIKSARGYDFATEVHAAIEDFKADAGIEA